MVLGGFQKLHSLSPGELGLVGSFHPFPSYVAAAKPKDGHQNRTSGSPELMLNLFLHCGESAILRLTPMRLYLPEPQPSQGLQMAGVRSRWICLFAPSYHGGPWTSAERDLGLGFCEAEHQLPG